MMTLGWMRAELTEEPGRAVRRLAAFALATTFVALVAGCAGDAAGGAAGEGTQEVFSTRSQSVLAREEPKVPVPAVAVPQLRTDPAELRTSAINLLQLACES